MSGLKRLLTTRETSPFDAISWSIFEVEEGEGDGGESPTTVSVTAPSSWSHLAVSVVARRYLMRGDSPERSVRDAIERVISAIGGWAAEHRQVEGAGDRETCEDELAALILSQKATFATPVWLNAGIEERPLTSACFILSTEDSMRGLLSWNTNEGLIFQQGGGSGINLSSVRSKSEPVSRGGLASGPVSFMRAADAWAATIRSGGRARRGAKMVVLDAGHPDVFEFIEAKAKEELRGQALLKAGYSVKEAVESLSFQHTNHSVRVPDELMSLLERGGDWPLRAVTTGKVVRCIPAERLIRACAEAAWACGDPGLQFSSTIQAWHTCPNAGEIVGSNPCGEFLHIPDSACNLASLNLLSFLDGGGAFDVKLFEHAVRLLITAQDAVIDGSGYPSEAIERNVKRLRPIGLGYANLGALLLRLGLPYDSPEGRALSATVTALMTGAAYRSSAELAQRLGSFSEFEANRDEMLAVIGMHREALSSLERSAEWERPAGASRAKGSAGVNEVVARVATGEGVAAPILTAAKAAWEQAQALGGVCGFRNAQVTLIPPTGTVSLMMDCETTGIEPYYAPVAVKKLEGGGEQRVGGAGTAFETAIGADHLSPRAQLEMVASVQPFLSGGVSKTVNLPNEATVDEIEQIFLDAWKLGLKSIAVYRDGSKISQPLRSVEGEA